MSANMPSCPHCGGSDVRPGWQWHVGGKRRLRLDCYSCGRFAAFPKRSPELVADADRESGKSGLLDVLIDLEAVGCEPARSGAFVGVFNVVRMTPSLRVLFARESGRLATHLLNQRRESMCRGKR